MEYEIVDEEDKEEMTEEERQLSMEIFNVATPFLPTLLEKLQKVDDQITGGMTVCWRLDGSVAVVTGNAPPSATVPILQKVLADLMGVDKDFIENAFAKERARKN